MEDQNAPATKSDIGALDRTIEHFDQKIEQLRSEVNHSYNDLAETIRDSETKLLQAFYAYAASNDKRLNFPPAA
jgi:hypothetical protein